MFKNIKVLNIKVHSQKFPLLTSTITLYTYGTEICILIIYIYFESLKEKTCIKKKKLLRFFCQWSLLRTIHLVILKFSAPNLIRNRRLEAETCNFLFFRNLLKQVDLLIRCTNIENALFPNDIQDYLQVLNIITFYLTVIPCQNWFLKISFKTKF